MSKNVAKRFFFCIGDQHKGFHFTHTQPTYIKRSQNSFSPTVAISQTTERTGFKLSGPLATMDDGHAALRSPTLSNDRHQCQRAMKFFIRGIIYSLKASCQMTERT